VDRIGTKNVGIDVLKHYFTGWQSASLGTNDVNQPSNDVNYKSIIL
jgi:hypothetical protein